jgi:hypothetical protein
MWKIQRLVSTPFRYRSGCHLGLREGGLKINGKPAAIDVNIGDAVKNANFGGEGSRITDIYWSYDELYRKGDEKNQASNNDDATNQSDGSDDNEEEGEE